MVPALIVTAALADLAFIGLCIRSAARRRSTAAAALFVVNIVLVMGLGALGSVDEQSVGLQWVEQGVNTVAAASFALAAWLLSTRES